MERNDHGGPIGGDDSTRTVFLASEIETFTTPKFRLTVVKGPDKGQERVCDELVVRIGSSQDNEFVLQDETVSRHHCRIDLERNGHRIRDLGSKNGVFIDSICVKDALLPHSCKIIVGDTHLKYREERETVDVEMTTGNRLGALIGSSPQMRHLFAMIQRISRTDATVLIEGESGTGKELTAQAVHDLSRQARGPFEILDCSAIPESIIESELFGHVRGAFTGAISTRKGAVESASGGTLFLDEIGELPLALQGKILRLIERKEIKPVGADNFRQVDVRIVAATNRVLKEEVAQGNFREDLYFRLAVVKLKIPPLRERGEDLHILTEHFLDDFSRRDNRHYTVSHSLLARLAGYDFPGNVRELRNILESAALFSDTVDLDIDLPTRPRISKEEGGFDRLLALPYKDAKEALVSSFEERYWNHLLETCQNNVSEAARRGGIHRKSLEYLIKKMRDKT